MISLNRGEFSAMTDINAGGNMVYAPKLLARLSAPERELGSAWPRYFSSGIGQQYRSSIIERANFAATLHALGGESETVRVIYGEGLIAPFQWIVIHESDTDSLKIGDSIQAGLAGSAIVDFDFFYKLEREEADLCWAACFDPADRIAYIRSSDLHFANYNNLIGCVRGKYFPGNASELLERLS